MPPRPGAVALARRSRSLGTAQGRPAGVVAPPPAATAEDVAFAFFPPSLSQLTPGGFGGSSLEDLEAHRQMPEDLVNTEHIDVNDGYNGEIPALLDC